MARVGPERFWCVSLDTAGVPHGGRYGDVAEFDAFCRGCGLTLAWNRFKGRFAVLSRRGQRWTYQLDFDRCCPDLARVIRHQRESFLREGAASIKERLVQAQRDWKQTMRIETAKRAYETYSDAVMAGIEAARKKRGAGRLMVTVPRDWRGGRNRSHAAGEEMVRGT